MVFGGEMCRVVFGVAFSASLLVTVVVTFVLMPLNRKAKNGAANPFMEKPLSLLYHNANVVLMLAESQLTNMHMRVADLPFAYLWTIGYLLFSWWCVAILMYCAATPLRTLWTSLWEDARVYFASCNCCRVDCMRVCVCTLPVRPASLPSPTPPVHGAGCSQRLARTTTSSWTIPYLFPRWR